MIIYVCINIDAFIVDIIITGKKFQTNIQDNANYFEWGKMWRAGGKSSIIQILLTKKKYLTWSWRCWLPAFQRPSPTFSWAGSSFVISLKGGKLYPYSFIFCIMESKYYKTNRAGKGVFKIFFKRVQTCDARGARENFFPDPLKKCSHPLCPFDRTHWID